MALPKQAVFPLSQHIGAPAVPCVAKGDMVKVGTKIADAGGFVSAAIFSSVSGKVAKIDSIIDASGYRKPAIFIDVQGDEWEETIDRSEELVTDCALEPAEIVAKIKDDPKADIHKLFNHVGYRQRSTAWRNFQKITGMTPTEFVNNLK